MDINMMISGLLAIIKYSTRKMLFSKRWVIVLLIIILVGAIMGYAGSWEGDSLQGGTDLMDVLILFFIMPVIAMIYGASLIRNEIDDKSITQVITSPLPRPISYIGYYISLVVTLSIIMVLINSVGWLAFFGQQGMGDGAGSILLIMMALGVIGSIAYSSLFLMSSVIFKRPIYIGLFYAFIWEGFVGSIPGAIGKYTLKHFIRSIGSGWLDFGEISLYDGASAGTAFGVLIGITVVCLAVGAFLFREKEYP
ncbi:MAG: ABC transporter permease [Candidatus Thermoplasmatota archaeon]|nr:ABC transporter permease [Candidatus Thermoplasmatota archaeon]